MIGRRQMTVLDGSSVRAASRPDEHETRREPEQITLFLMTHREQF